jgi:hypothetical protein
VNEGTEVHCAGVVVSYTDAGSRTMRQRCAWCGALLLEFTDTPFPAVDFIHHSTYEVYTLVRVDGADITPLTKEDFPGPNLEMPEDSCFRIDQAVTK